MAKRKRRNGRRIQKSRSTRRLSNPPKALSDPLIQSILGGAGGAGVDLALAHALGAGSTGLVAAAAAKGLGGWYLAKKTGYKAAGHALIGAAGSQLGYFAFAKLGLQPSAETSALALESPVQMTTGALEPGVPIYDEIEYDEEEDYYDASLY